MYRLVVSLMTVALLAGCSAVGQGVPQRTAEELLEVARVSLSTITVANEPMENSSLLGAWCFESESAYEAFNDRLPWPDPGSASLWQPGRYGDSTMADGKCDAWAYRFVSPSGRHGIAQGVERVAGAIHTASFTPGQREVPLAPWRTDSDDAIRSAKRALANLATAADERDDGLDMAYVLTTVDAVPTWRIIATDGLLHWTVTVDATSGKVTSTYEA